MLIRAESTTLLAENNLIKTLHFVINLNIYAKLFPNAIIMKRK